MDALGSSPCSLCPEVALHTLATILYLVGMGRRGCEVKLTSNAVGLPPLHPVTSTLAQTAADVLVKWWEGGNPFTSPLNLAIPDEAGQVAALAAEDASTWQMTRSAKSPYCCGDLWQLGYRGSGHILVSPLATGST